MPWWWTYLCWSLSAMQVGVCVYVWRLAREAKRVYREAQEQREQAAKNLAESERLLDQVFGFEAAVMSGEPPPVH